MDGASPDVDAASRRVAIMALGDGDCRFPVNAETNPAGHLFCGLEAERGQSYCPHHRARSRGSGTHSERDAARALQQFQGRAA